MKKTFAYEVGRHGIEYLYNKGYSLPEIARIYDVSVLTVHTACYALYGNGWKEELNKRRAAYNANPQLGFAYDFSATVAIA